MQAPGVVELIAPGEPGSIPIASCPWCSAMQGADVPMTPCFGTHMGRMTNNAWWCQPCGHTDDAIHTERFTLEWWDNMRGANGR